MVLIGQVAANQGLNFVPAKSCRAWEYYRAGGVAIPHNGRGRRGRVVQGHKGGRQCHRIGGGLRGGCQTQRPKRGDDMGFHETRVMVMADGAESMFIPSRAGSGLRFQQKNAAGIASSRAGLAPPNPSED